MRGPDDADLTGAVLNRRWRVVRRLGSGGLGIVVEVVGLGGEGARAAKLLRHEFRDEPEVVERFLGEADLVARLSHPGIARVFEAARAEDGTPYLVLELCRGEPLSALMNRERVPVERAVSLAASVLDALGAAHRAGVVHRDLKPDNVFLAQDGSGHEQVKLLDFGVARALEAAGGASRRTRTGMLLGTPGYMSPEQMRNAKDATPKSDLWAVGVLFYELLAGQRAFGGKTELERVTDAFSCALLPIERVAPQYAHWGSFFARALAAEPSCRFSDAAEMAAAMLAVARGTPRAPEPPAEPSAPPPAAAFGGTDTAISPVVTLAAGSSRLEPSVVIVPPRRRVVLLGVACAMSLLALLVGLGLGYLLGSR